MISFTVYGVAQPKGSMRAFVPPGMKHPIVTDSNRNAKSWAQLVAHAAATTLAQTPDGAPQLLQGPVRVSVAFDLPRPKKFNKRGVPIAHLTAPDLDKLLRSVLDALTAVVWHDDSQVVEVLAQKRYAEVAHPPCAHIRVEAANGFRPLLDEERHHYATV